MDPDTEVTAPPRRRVTGSGAAAGAALIAIIALGIALRVWRFGAGDYYEDGASHWWTAAYAYEHGEIVDPFGLNHLGYWLPGYDQLAASLMILAGSEDQILLRSLSTAAWAAAALCLYALTRPAGAGVALFATALFALSPFNILDAAISSGVEVSVALLLLGLFFARKAREGRPVLLWGMMGAFSVAVLFRYEAAVFVLAYLVHGWWWEKGDRLDGYFTRQARPYLLATLAIMAVFLAFTWGHNFVSRVLVGPTPDYVYAQQHGFVSTGAFARGASFWLTWAPPVAAGATLALAGIALYLGRIESWLVVSFCVLLTVFLFGGLGTASFRYIAPIEPLMWLMAALALRRIGMVAAGVAAWWPAADRRRLIQGATTLVVATLVLTSSFFSMMAVMHDVDNQLALDGPLRRAATFVAALPQDPDLLVVMDSPIAAQASGLPAARMFGSALLPNAREAAMQVLRDRVQYVVAVNVTYYKLMTLFPELALGRSNENFSLLYDATGWEFPISVKTAWVYEVNRDHAVIALAPGVFVHIPLENPTAGTKTSGLALWGREAELTAGAPGLAAPELVVNGTRYVAANATGVPPSAVGEPTFRVLYTMLPRRADGTFDTAAPRGVVEARYAAQGSVLSVDLTVNESPSGLPFVLTANNSVSATYMPYFANSSQPQPSPGPEGPARIWSLRNWLEGDNATLQIDYTDPLALTFGREGNRTLWLAQSAPLGAPTLAYKISTFAAGQAPYDPNEPVTWEGPLRRAGGYLGGLDTNGSSKILADGAFGQFPWVRESSGLPAERFVNSSQLPAGHDDAVAWLRANVDFVVALNVTEDGVLARFPELAAGESGTAFSLFLDDRGPGSAGAEPEVWVYRVNREEGWVPVPGVGALRFSTAATGAAGPTGLEPWSGSNSLLGAARGLGVPTATVNGTNFSAKTVNFSFLAGSAGRLVEARWTLASNMSASPLTVVARYEFNGSLVTVNMTATDLPAGASLTLGVTNQLNATLFPNYVNDSAWVNQTGPATSAMITGLRNWIVAPGAIAVQIDYRDPLVIYYDRSPGSTVAISFRASADATTLEYTFWVIPDAYVPYP